MNSLAIYRKKRKNRRVVSFVNDRDKRVVDIACIYSHEGKNRSVNIDCRAEETGESKVEKDEE